MCVEKSGVPIFREPVGEVCSGESVFNENLSVPGYYKNGSLLTTGGEDGSE